MKLSKSKERLPDRLKKNEKSQNQVQNGLMHIGRLWVKKRTKDGSFSNQKNTKYSWEYIAK